jgi:hypothetical protein
MWPVLIGGAALLFAGAALSRRAKQRAAVAGLRREFPRIARMRLVAACPSLEGVIDEAMLRRVFDWMLIEMFRRAGVSSFGELMRWSVKQGEVETAWLAVQVTDEAARNLPLPVRSEIDRCGAGIMTSVILNDALTEAGQRISPELEQYV